MPTNKLSLIRDSIAEHILYGSLRQKLESRRLWLQYKDRLGDQPLVQLLKNPVPIPAPLKNAVAEFRLGIHQILPEVFSDLESVYVGCLCPAMDKNSLYLWKLIIGDDGKSYEVSASRAIVQLPVSELQERSLEDIITEAVSEGAWG